MKKTKVMAMSSSVASSNSGVNSDVKYCNRVWVKYPSRAIKKKIKTSFGTLDCPKQHVLTHLVHPFQISPYLQDQLLFLGQQNVFAQASDTLKRLLGQGVSAKQIERLCHYYGHLLEADPGLEPPSADGPVYAMVDGSMVLTRPSDWREIKLARVFSTTDNSCYISHLGHYSDFLDKFQQILPASEQVVFVADGALWFWDWVSSTHPGARQILDYYHAKSYLSEFAQVYFKDQHRRQHWLAQQQDLLLQDQIETVITSIQALPSRGTTDYCFRKKLLSYYRNNKDRMYYGSYRAQGLLIGSGPIEAAHRHVIQQRMKLSGQRWTRAGVQAVANIRVHHVSNRWSHVIKLVNKTKTPVGFAA